jgi:hypothetical protein
MAEEYEVLEEVGDFGFTADVAFDILEADYGDGYEDAALVGSSDGLRSWQLMYKALPGTIQNAPEAGPLSMQSRADYLWDFFIRHKAAGNKPFLITCLRDGQQYLAKFVEHRLSYQMFMVKLFSTGVQLRQRRDGDVWV